ncbi:GNAT family N-acetyltransferase [Nocardioides sp.]|uniref:GNAT family N-acetyltransferase n=1 Tax=Nocardioides sp. TaxID=35761 RepID=UPI0039E47DD7
MAIDVATAVGRFDDFRTVVGPKTGIRGCWCTAYRCGASLDMAERVDYMRRKCSTDPGPGVLAYVDGQPAGWCSVAPRSSYRRLMRSRTIPVVGEGDPWSVVCFVVRAGFRRRGLMHDLLEGAVEHASVHGAAVIEGYAADAGEDRVDPISGYIGTVALFEAHGFQRAAETGSRLGGKPRWVMRRELR